jgi:hypothetical protein
MRRRALLATATATTGIALAGCLSGKQHPDVVTLTITSTGGYTGNLRAHEMAEQIDATGETTYEWTDDLPGSIRLTLYTGSRTDTTLTATVHEDAYLATKESVTGANEHLNLVHTI